MTPVATTEKPVIELPERPTFREAAAAAIAAHAGDAGNADEAADDDGDAGDEGDGADKPAADAKVADDKADKVDEKPAADQNALLSDDEFTTLQTTHKDDPKALRKALEGAFTKKTQALAAERTSVERLKEFEPIIDAYEADPKATVLELAKQHGLQLVDPDAKDTKAVDAAAATPQPKLADFDYDVDKWSEAHADWSGKELQRQVAEALKPLKSSQDTILTKAAIDQTASIMKTFEGKHPDWQKHEAEMTALSQKLHPNGMDELEYLDHIYSLVTAETSDVRQAAIDAKVAEGVKAALKKLQKGADTVETRVRDVPESQVKNGPPEGRPATFQEAAAAARRGERW